MFTVIAFDIVNDRTRYRVVQDLRACAVRVQKSVFEAPELTTQALQRLRQTVDARLAPAVDKVRYYPLCGACRERVVVTGPGGVTAYEEFTVI